MLTLWYFSYFFYFVLQLSWSGAAAWQLYFSLEGVDSQYPKNTLINTFVLTWLIFHRPGAGQTGRLWEGNGRRNKQAGQCLPGGGWAAGGSEARSGWRAGPRQMPTVTFPDYGLTQAGTPATAPCPGGMEDRGGGLQHTCAAGGVGGRELYGSVCIKHDALFS